MQNLCLTPNRENNALLFDLTKSKPTWLNSWRDYHAGSSKEAVSLLIVYPNKGYLCKAAASYKQRKHHGHHF
jgi:hypothetical protein